MTCSCGASIPADTYLCASCAGRLDQHLGNVPAWVEELETTLTGEKSQTFIARGSAAVQTLTKPENDKGDEESPLHYNERAGDIKRQLVTDLRTPAITVVGRFLPVMNVDAKEWNDPMWLARLLLRNFDHIPGHPEAPTWLRRLDRISDRVEHIIDVTAPRNFLGICTKLTDDGPCGGGIYAAEGSPTGACETCKEGYDTAACQEVLHRALEDQLCTIEELGHFSVILGLPRARVLRTVSGWHRRGLILAHAHTDQGEPMFTYGDVRNRLATLETS